MMRRQNEKEQEIEFQPFNDTPSSRVVNGTTLTRTLYTPTSGIICACVIVLLLFSNCVLLGRVASGIQGTNSELQVQRQNVEYKTIVWDEDKFEVNPRSFFKAMMREGLTNNTFASCSWPQYTENYSVNGRTMAGQWLRFFENNDRISKGCVVDAWLNKAAETKWLATNLLQYYPELVTTYNHYIPYLTFTRTAYTVQFGEYLQGARKPPCIL